MGILLVLIVLLVTSGLILFDDFKGDLLSVKVYNVLLNAEFFKIEFLCLVFTVEKLESCNCGGYTLLRFLPAESPDFWIILFASCESEAVPFNSKLD